MTQLEKLAEIVTRFRKERNWEQFHNPKDQALSLALEAAEVMEHFQWKNEEQIRKYLETDGKEKVKEELADVLIYLLHMAHDLGIDLEEAVCQKIEKNAKKYPVEKAYGVATKYTQL